MINKKSISCLYFALSAVSCFSHAKADEPIKHHPLYVGGIGGFGSTTWFGLVPSKINQNIAITMSTPINTYEGGHLWGFMGGYEFTDFFAVEANYLKYPKATVFFDPFSIFSFNNHDATWFISDTESVSLMGKVMLIIPQTPIRIFSSAGVANVHRSDMILDDWRPSPTFGFGINFPVTEHFMAELAGNYTAGYGESQLDPTDTYFPFLYSGTFRLAWRF